MVVIQTKEADLARGEIQSSYLRIRVKARLRSVEEGDEEKSAKNWRRN